MALSEAQFERIADAMVWRRLAGDSAYRNAENAHDQATREVEITDQVVAELVQKHGEPI